MSDDNSKLCDLGVIGVGVMGANLALNLADHAHDVAVFDVDADRARAFAADHPPESISGGSINAFASLDAFTASLKTPRVAIVLVPAGAPTDGAIGELAGRFSAGDIICDCGNSHFPDTSRRVEELAARKLHFLGCGTSGGAEGARFGPSLMAGCSVEAWERVGPLFSSIAAKVDRATGKPIEGASPANPVSAPDADACAARVGPGASGHYVKMVHNGIEYADMQLIAEAYHLLRDIAGLEPSEIGDVFASWNDWDLDSYLIEITADILRQADPVSGEPFVDVVLDAAGQKGTGKWTSIAALDMGTPAATIAEAVFARAISARKDIRLTAAKRLSGPSAGFKGDSGVFVDNVRNALYCSKLCAYAQGFDLMRDAEAEFDWDLDFASIASIWRGGCIIRARLLHHITEAYRASPDLPSLLLHETFRDQIRKFQDDWRRVVSMGATLGVPTPAFSSALASYDSLRCARLPASLIQAQRDYFGGHTYERIDQPRGSFFHLDWSDPDRPQREA